MCIRDSSCDLPLLVDADTGWGNAFMVSRTIREMTRAGAAGCHIEDQVSAKRCGHRPGKELVSINEMNDRLKAAVDARQNDFTIIARTDAHATEGLSSAIDRAQAYEEAGADIIFAEALTNIKEYKKFTSNIKVPVLANLTEFGMTPLFTITELEEAGISIVLYPLSASRAMSLAAENVFNDIRAKGTQKDQIKHMQNRDDLYETLKYKQYEEKIDKLFTQKKTKNKTSD